MSGSFRVSRPSPVEHAAQMRRPLLLVLLLLLGGLFAVPSQASTGDEPSSVQSSFTGAGMRWNVPVAVLMAVGYVESHWEQRLGQPSLDGGFGIMHLVDGPDGTLALASQLTGLPMDSLKTLPSSNIEGGAALLADAYRKLSMTQQNTTNTSLWFQTVAAYSGATDATVRDEYARQVFRVMQGGVGATLASGETLSLQGSAAWVMPPQPKAQSPNSIDYGPALWTPANSNNYSVGRQYGPLSFVIVHDTEGSYSSAINWFQNASSGVSAQYVIRSSDGQITQMVRDANTAYQAGVWDYNVRSIGIEHEGYASQSSWYTDAMYQASAALVSTLADRYGLKKDRAHIIGHYQVPNQTHVDPGPNWNWTRYMSLVRGDSNLSSLVDNGDAAFSTMPAPVDPQNSWFTYGNGYNGSTSLAAPSASSQQASANSATWTGSVPSTGYYDVYAFIPYVDNNTPDTSSARYTVFAADGTQTVSISQKAITDIGSGSWAHIGKFLFNAGDATVGLSNYTGESGRNVWFDALMWIPASAGGATPTSQPTPPRTSTPTPPMTSTPTDAPNTPWPTNTRQPQATYTRSPQATDTPSPEPTWTPGPCNMRFTDLPDSSWAYSYVVNLYCRNVISGFSDGTFRPNQNSTRGQFTKMLALSFSWSLFQPTAQRFTDVPLDSPYSAFIETAFRQGVIAGYPDGSFRYNDPVTRAQAVKMIMLAHGWPQQRPSNPTFADIPPLSWAFGYVEGAYRQGIINGYSDATFRPQNPITRAQVAKTLTLATGAIPLTRRLPTP